MYGIQSKRGAGRDGGGFKTRLQELGLAAGVRDQLASVLGLDVFNDLEHDVDGLDGVMGWPSQSGQACEATGEMSGCQFDRVDGRGRRAFYDETHLHERRSHRAEEGEILFRKTKVGSVEGTKGVRSRREGKKPKTAKTLAFLDVDVAGRERGNREPLEFRELD